jgi:hypothetical protein
MFKLLMYVSFVFLSYSAKSKLQTDVLTTLKRQ